MSEESSKPNADGEYKFQINKNSGCGSCLIINIDETWKSISRGCSVKKFRTGAKREVERLKGAFSGQDYRHKEIGEMNEKNLDEEIKEYIDTENPKNFKEDSVFVCVLLAFGGPGYFYNRKGEKKSLSTIISKFRDCKNLIQKPKLFIVQTCDVNLRPVGKHLFRDEEPSVAGTKRWPKEADILIYESNISGEYDWHPGLRKNSSGKNSSGKRNYPALKCSTFIKTLCETFDNVQKEEASSQERIDINEIILRTNLKLVKFIDNKMNWDLQDESWSSGPRLPIVTDQFCKQLKFPPKKQKNKDKPNDE